MHEARLESIAILQITKLDCFDSNTINLFSVYTKFGKVSMHTVTVMQAASNFTMILVSLAAVADLTMHGIIVTMDNKHNVTSTSAACVC